MKQMAVAGAVSILAMAGWPAQATPALTTAIPVPGWTEDEWNVGFTLKPTGVPIGSSDETGLPSDRSASAALLDERALQDGQQVSGSSGMVADGSGQAPGRFASAFIFPGPPDSDPSYVVPKDHDSPPFVTVTGEAVWDVVFGYGQARRGDTLMAIGSGNGDRTTASDRASLLASDNSSTAGVDAVLSAPALFAGGMSISSEAGGMIGAVGPIGITTGAGASLLNSGMAVVVPRDFVSVDSPSEAFFDANESDAMPASGNWQYVSAGGASTFVSELPGNLSSGWSPSSAPIVSAAPANVSPHAVPSGRPEDTIEVNIQQITDWLRNPSNVLLAGSALVVLGGLGSLRRRE